MANVEIFRGKNARVFKDGEYLGTITDFSLDGTQNTVSTFHLGDGNEIIIPTTKNFEGSFTRDSIDESMMNVLLGRVITSSFSLTNYTDNPTSLKGTVVSATPYDAPAFTTPNTSGIVLERATFYLKKVGSFAGGLSVEVWEGAAGGGTLKGTLSVPAADIPTDGGYVTALLHPESSELSLTHNVSHQLRFKAAGSPTGSVEVYGVVADADPYYALDFEVASVDPAEYTIDFTLVDSSGTTAWRLKDTGVTFLSNGMNISATELITEATSWRAKKRVLL